MDCIDDLIDESKDMDYEKAVKKIDTFKEKLKKYRTAGLEKDGEFSYENLVFKFLFSRSCSQFSIDLIPRIFIFYILFHYP